MSIASRMDTQNGFEEKRIPTGGPVWAGMGNYRLVSPDGAHVAELVYEGEPPHGDSYHSLSLDGRDFPGHAWGCLFAFTADSRYFGFSWMAQLYERKTVVADLLEKKFFVLPHYLYDFTLQWPTVMGSGEHDNGVSYVFSGAEKWVGF